MRAFGIWGIAIASILSTAAGPAVAEDYWSYSLGSVEVVTADGSGRAVALAQNLMRFDAALAQILEVPAVHLPTHVYELPSRVTAELLGDPRLTSYRSSDYEVTVLTGVTPLGSGMHNWGPLFGYAGARVATGRAARSPHWFKIGVPDLFATTEFDFNRVKTGGLNRAEVVALAGKKLIPTRVLLRLDASDPQLTSQQFRTLFQAESWYLAREVFVEAMLRPEFGRYLDLIRDGSSEPEAFTASFKLSYEDLDKRLYDALSRPIHIYVLNVPHGAPAEGEARRLSPAEADARLAEIYLRSHQADGAQRLVDQALREDPTSELALRVRARLSLRREEFGAALADADKLATLPAPSAPGLTDRGEILMRLAAAVSNGDASVGADAATLDEHARAAFEDAVHADPEELRAWADLAGITARRADSAAAKTLLARAQPVLERHRENGALARELARMCVATGQRSAAIPFAEIWRDDAISLDELSRAKDLIARLQAQNGAPPTGAP
jgi:tetratricopeptide (TPR) repeat protein